MFEAAIFPPDRNPNHSPQLVVSVCVAATNKRAPGSSNLMERAMLTCGRLSGHIDHNDALNMLGELLGLDLRSTLERAGIMPTEIAFGSKTEISTASVSDISDGRATYGFVARFPVTRESFVRSDLARVPVPA